MNRIVFHSLMFSKLSSAICAVALLAGFAGSANAANYVLKTSDVGAQDGFIYQGTAGGPAGGQNFKTGVGLTSFGQKISLVNVDTARDAYGLVQFNLASLNLTGDDIGSAILRLYVNPATAFAASVDASNPVNVDVYRVTSAWNQNTVTWNTAPTYDTTLITTTEINGTGAYFDFDLTSLVKDWLDADSPLANFGILMNIDNFYPTGGSPTSYGVSFNSSTNPGGFAPELGISLVPEPSSIMLAAMAGVGLFGLRKRFKHRVRHQG